MTKENKETVEFSIGNTLKETGGPDETSKSRNEFYPAFSGSDSLS